MDKPLGDYHKDTIQQHELNFREAVIVILKPLLSYMFCTAHLLTS